MILSFWAPRVSKQWRHRSDCTKYSDVQILRYFWYHVVWDRCLARKDEEALFIFAF